MKRLLLFLWVLRSLIWQADAGQCDILSAISEGGAVEIDFAIKEKSLRTIPQPIQNATIEWIKRTQDLGLYEVRRTFGGKYHDEGLSGDRNGQRSVRLNQQWRLIYQEIGANRIRVIEITPHKY